MEHEKVDSTTGDSESPTGGARSSGSMSTHQPIISIKSNLPTLLSEREKTEGPRHLHKKYMLRFLAPYKRSTVRISTTEWYSSQHSSERGTKL